MCSLCVDGAIHNNNTLNGKNETRPFCGGGCPLSPRRGPKRHYSFRFMYEVNADGSLHPICNELSEGKNRQICTRVTLTYRDIVGHLSSNL